MYQESGPQLHCNLSFSLWYGLSSWQRTEPVRGWA